MSHEAHPVFCFAEFELDTGKFELRARGEVRHVEPQVLSLLLLLIGNAERLVGKEEIVERIWDGRAVSEAAVASRVKAARQALGDDGTRQAFIRTVHGKGFRFVAPVTPIMRTPAAALALNPAVQPAPGSERPAIAVLPFRIVGPPGPLAFVAQALAEELITGLSRLHWLLVIARGSTFRFQGCDFGTDVVGPALGAAYCLTGTFEETAGAAVITANLLRTSDEAVLWSERYTAAQGDFPALRAEIIARTLSCLETRIMQHEVRRARRMCDAELGAWSCYHLGLDHMFRFNRSDNASARTLFEKAAALDPGFARAYAGLSFTAFQECFLQYSNDCASARDLAHGFAEQAIRCDPLDPFAQLCLGRSLWLTEAPVESIGILSDTIALSPSYAQAIYSRAWAEMILGQADRSDEDAALALRLSPLDPLRYAMLAVRSVSALLKGDAETAALWGERAAHAPGAHKHVVLIAALANQAAGNTRRAGQWVGKARDVDPDISVGQFLQSFPFAPSEGRENVENALSALQASLL